MKRFRISWIERSGFHVYVEAKNKEEALEKWGDAEHLLEPDWVEDEDTPCIYQIDDFGDLEEQLVFPFETPYTTRSSLG